MKLIVGDDGVKTSLVGAGIDHPATVAFISVSVPYVEIVLGAWVAIGVLPRLAVGSSIAFLSAATMALVSLGISSGWSVTCYCTGLRIGDPVGVAVVRNLLLLAVAISIARRVGAAHPKVLLASNDSTCRTAAT